MKFADLHAHTCFSDGSLTPQQLVELGAQKGLSALAVTDHDTVDGVERALAHGRKIGLEVIPGLEFSSQLEGRNLHLVGLFVDPRSQALQRVCQKMQQMRDQRNRQMLRQLEEAGFPVSEETFRDFQGTSLTRAHVADVLIRAGYGGNMKEVFQNYMSKGKPGYVARQVVPPEECIDAIHQAGGLAFVATSIRSPRTPIPASASVWTPWIWERTAWRPGTVSLTTTGVIPLRRSPAAGMPLFRRQ